MVGAALLARNAVDRGLNASPGEDHARARVQVVMDYYERAGLVPYLDKSAST